MQSQSDQGSRTVGHELGARIEDRGSHGEMRRQGGETAHGEHRGGLEALEGGWGHRHTIVTSLPQTIRHLKPNGRLLELMLDAGRKVLGVLLGEENPGEGISCLDEPLTAEQEVQAARRRTTR